MNRSGSNPNMFSSSISSLPYSNPTKQQFINNPYKLHKEKVQSVQSVSHSKSPNNSAYQINNQNNNQYFLSSSPTFRHFGQNKDIKQMKDSRQESQSPQSKLKRTESSNSIINFGSKTFQKKQTFNPYNPLQNHTLVQSKILKSGLSQMEVKQEQTKYYKKLYENQLLQDQQKTRTLNRVYQQKQKAVQNAAGLTAKLQKASLNYQSLLISNEKIVERLKQDHKKQIIDINQRTLQRLNNKDEILSEELKKVKAQNLKQMQYLRQHYERLLDKANLQFQELRKESLIELQKLHQENNQKINSLSQKNSNQMQLLMSEKQKQYSLRISQLEKDSRQKLIAANKALQQIKEQLNKTIQLKEQTRNDYNNQIMSLKSQFLKENQLVKSEKQDLLTKMQRKNKQQINNLKAQLLKKEINLKQKQEKIRNLEDDIQRCKGKQIDWIREKQLIITRYQDSKVGSDNTFRQSLQEMKKQHDKVIQSLKKQYKNVIQDMTKNEQVQRIKIQYQHELQRATVTLTQQIQDINKKLIESKNENFQTTIQMKNQHTIELQRIQNSHKSQISILKRQHQDDYSKWKYDFDAAINDFTNQCQKMQKDHIKQLQQLKTNLKKNVDKANEQKLRDGINLKKQIQQYKSQLNKISNDLDLANQQIMMKRTQLALNKSQYEKLISLNTKKSQQLEDTIKKLQKDISKKQQQINQLKIQIVNDKKAHDLQLQSKSNKIKDIQRQILQLQAKQLKKSDNQQQIFNYKKKVDQERQQLQKKHFRQIQCLNEKISMLNDVINKKQEAIRKQRQQHNDMIQGLFHNSNKKKQEKMIQYKTQDKIKTSPQGMLNDQLSNKIRELQRQNNMYIDQIQSLENTNKKLRQQLMSNLNTFDKEKELYEEINMLKAKVKGYQQYKKLSKVQSQSNLNTFSGLSIHTTGNDKQQISPLSRSYSKIMKQRLKKNNYEDDQYEAPNFGSSYKKDSKDISGSSYYSSKNSSRAKMANISRQYQQKNDRSYTIKEQNHQRQRSNSPKRQPALLNKISPAKAKLNRVLFNTEANQYHGDYDTDKRYNNNKQLVNSKSSNSLSYTRLNVSNGQQEKTYFYRK